VSRKLRASLSHVSDTILRNVGINSVLALLSTTCPLAPVAISSHANGTESNWLTTRISVEGNSLDATSSVEANHHRIVISSSTTCGLCSRALRQKDLADAAPTLPTESLSFVLFKIL
jgi:hypothetical protein